MSLLAHGSGLDEMLAFAAFPALWGLYELVRWIRKRVRAQRGVDSPP